MYNSRFTSPRKKVAREAAVLLYTQQEKEYKQAKMRALKTLGIRILPSNADVARELDEVAEETEGPTRRDLLLQMRKEALEIMKTLERFNPRLVGSVWRGTANKRSDIDITVFSANPDAVIGQIQENKFRITEKKAVSVLKNGEKKESFHVFLRLPTGNQVEIVIRSPEDALKPEKCEIYGDPKTGLNYIQLRRVIEENPLRKFVPEK
jgi:predicted nucleotidyltransferase